MSDYNFISMNKKIKILLYYKYVPILDPEKVCREQKIVCQELHIKGRIIVSAEGINGTVAGEEKDIDSYITQTQSIPEFSDIEWKISWTDSQVFPKLRVVVRDEIVTLGVKKTGKDVSLSNKAEYITPEELQALYDQNADFVILDARNKYEATIGKFKDALIPPIDNFREFPEFVEHHLRAYKDKEIVTYCTGGVRCEKASAYLREHGFKKVRQLHGGVHDYAEKTGGKYFEGELFVFDKRLHISVNDINPVTLTSCRFCTMLVTRYVDCIVPSCDEFLTCCETCEQTHQVICSDSCLEKLKELNVVVKG